MGDDQTPILRENIPADVPLPTPPEVVPNLSPPTVSLQTAATNLAAREQRNRAEGMQKPKDAPPAQPPKPRKENPPLHQHQAQAT